MWVWLEWLPVVALVAVAALQRYRMRAVDQSAWKGGGFGMFSDLPRAVLLPVATIVTRSGERQTMAMDPAPPTAAQSYVPTSPRIAAWGKQILQGSWVPCCGSAHACPSDTPNEAVTLIGLRIEHRRFDFDGATGEYRTRPVREYVIHEPTETVTSAS